MEIQHVTHRLDATKAIKTKANNGVRYRTLCARCNNSLLGGRYDPVLIDFTRIVSEFIASDIVLPSVMSVPTKPPLLMRAIWGHLAAVGVDRYLKSNAEEWRDFFLDETLPVPSNINFYYWIYPYRRQVLLRDMVCLDISQHVARPSVFWLMKFYPLAFAVWMPEKTHHTLDFLDMTSYRAENVDDLVEVVVDLARVPHELTLESPTETLLLFIGRDSVIANSRPPRGRVLEI